MSGAGSLVTYLHGVVGTRQVAVRYVVNKEGRIVPTVSQERIRSWVTSLSTPEERTPVKAINDVDSAGTVLQLARPGKAGRKAGNIEPATTALVQGLGQGRSVSQQISWNEVPHSTENRVVPNGPERFAYQAKAGEKWVDVNLTDSTLTAYEGQKVVYGPILINHGGVGHETVTGTYKIYLRYQAQDMGCTPEWPYCERGVPWVSYWHDSYALHGAPWVKEFGIGTDESSHGCINIPVPDAQAIWQWSEIGTTVVTHY
ncbi:L,D-transpeptidase [Actinomyces oris]|uniref:L,D-transpeptidase n=1 Tax=Actinomyces oris TaxID=544580 RepID=UPI002805FE1C|nr:L,D-transpeptidase [Actinomyces oris]